VFRRNSHKKNKKTPFQTVNFVTIWCDGVVVRHVQYSTMDKYLFGNFGGYFFVMMGCGSEVVRPVECTVVQTVE
jgi:hypothetical protein